jgi:hypothetical protein
LQDAPAGDDPDVGDIGYYAPSQDLVLYYGDVGYWDGIVGLGRFDGSALAVIERLEDGVEISVERS